MNNAERLARNSVLDGIRLTFPYQDAEWEQQRFNAIMSELAEATNQDETTVRNRVKFSRIKSGGKSGRELAVYFISGREAKAFSSTSLVRYYRAATEWQCKFYLIPKEGNSNEAFVDACYYADGGKFSAKFYGASKSKRSKRDGGSKGVTFGSQKSDVHVTLNRYANERTGVETHVKGKAASKMQQDLRTRQRSRGTQGDARENFRELFAEASLRGARRFLQSVRSRGIILTDYFVGVSHISWAEPLHDKSFHVLDADEERAIVLAGAAENEEGEADQEVLPGL